MVKMPPVDLAVHVVELVAPNLLDLRGSRESRAEAVVKTDVLEVREVIEDPTDRQLHQIDLGAEQIRTIGLDDVADAAPVGLVVFAHQRALVADALLQQQLDGVGAVVPGRRAVADGTDPGDSVEGGKSPFQNVPFLLLGAKGAGFSWR